MYDAQQFKNLQNKSHVRGLLSKQFYSLQQNQLQRKRKQMKQILDQQVEQRRRQKQRVKFQQERKQRKEQQEIKKYYNNLQTRNYNQLENDGMSKRDHNKKPSKATYQNQHQHQNQHQNSRVNNSNDKITFRNHNQNYDNSNLANQTFPKERSRMKTNQRQEKGSNMPVMVLQMDDLGTAMGAGGWNGKNIANRHSNANVSLNIPSTNTNAQQNSYNNPNMLNKYMKSSSGNIPLLDLSDERNVNFNHNQNGNQNEHSYNQGSMRNGNQNSSKRNKEKSPNKNHQQIPRSSNLDNQLVSGNSNQLRQSPSNSQHQNANVNNYNPYHSFSPTNNQSRKFQENQINIFAPQQQTGTRRNTENREFISEMAASRHQVYPQLQSQNKVLKKQLKKSQQAISLLIGAMRSNNRLDKFRVQAQKILHGNSTNPILESQNQRQSRVISGMQKNQSEDKLMLPKLNLRHQSIMHDYMFGAARKAKSKTQKMQKANLAVVQENLKNGQFGGKARPRK